MQQGYLDISGMLESYSSYYMYKQNPQQGATV